MQFLYADGTTPTSWTSRPSSRSRSPRRRWATRCGGSCPNEEVDVLYIDGEPADLQVPSGRRDGGHRDRAGPARRHRLRRRRQARDARVRRRCSVPLFVNVGDRVRVDTRTGEYVSARADERGRRSDQRTCVWRPSLVGARAPGPSALYQRDVTGRSAVAADRPARHFLHARAGRGRRAEQPALDAPDRAPFGGLDPRIASPRSSATSCGWRSTS